MSLDEMRAVLIGRRVKLRFPYNHTMGKAYPGRIYLVTSFTVAYHVTAQTVREPYITGVMATAEDDGKTQMNYLRFEDWTDADAVKPEGEGTIYPELRV